MSSTGAEIRAMARERVAVCSGPVSFPSERLLKLPPHYARAASVRQSRRFRPPSQYLDVLNFVVTSVSL